MHNASPPARTSIQDFDERPEHVDYAAAGGENELELQIWRTRGDCSDFAVDPSAQVAPGRGGLTAFLNSADRQLNKGLIRDSAAWDLLRL
jgi:hypothetical protein